ncbi:hypothetical protein J2738_003480 [Variovorax paradoxus]|uniref:Cardiolipin synthase N-terminal domain-containing protein n=1 Tax=Variovorax paradoxus TaxID=34073 RepID=A0AAE4BZC6_VARPD|nr:hypothetical protein [Variovorax paradoxus]MDR6427325.1 hypothetical protein [Variovorax paradoxus]MDR6454486.1 hypothetical protein [Variovorax paradoxus]
MSPWSWLGLAFAAALLVYDVYVVTLVLRSDAFGRSQKLAQIALVLLLPVIGAAIVHWFAREGVAPLPRPDREFVPQDRPTLGQR